MNNRLRCIECCDIKMSAFDSITYTYEISELMCYYKLFFDDPSVKILRELLTEGEKVMEYHLFKSTETLGTPRMFINNETTEKIIRLANNRITLNDTLARLKHELPKGSVWSHKDYTCNPSSNALTVPIVIVEDEPHIMFDHTLQINVISIAFSVCDVIIDADNRCWFEKTKLCNLPLKKFLRDFANEQYERCTTPMDLVCRFENNFTTLYCEYEGSNVGWSLTHTKDYDCPLDVYEVVDFLDSCKDEQETLDKLSVAVDEFLHENDIDLCLKE